jgi:hypothetical protein
MTDHTIEKKRRTKEKVNDPIERAAKKARTEAKALQVPSDYTGIRAGSVYFAVEASVGGEKKLFAGWYVNVHLAALVYNAFVGATFHQARYNHVEKHVDEDQLRELQREALSAVKSKRGKWAEQWSKWRGRPGRGHARDVRRGGRGGGRRRGGTGPLALGMC